MAMYRIFGVSPPPCASTPTQGQRLVVGRWKTAKSSECLSPTTPDRSMVKGTIPWVPFLKGGKANAPPGVGNTRSTTVAGAKKAPAQRPLSGANASQKQTGDTKSPARSALSTAQQRPRWNQGKPTKVVGMISKTNSIKRPSSTPVQQKPTRNENNPINDAGLTSNASSIRTTTPAAAKQKPRWNQSKLTKDVVMRSNTTSVTRSVTPAAQQKPRCNQVKPSKALVMQNNTTSVTRSVTPAAQQKPRCNQVKPSKDVGMITETNSARNPAPTIAQPKPRWNKGKPSKVIAVVRNTSCVRKPTPSAAHPNGTRNPGKHNKGVGMTSKAGALNRDVPTGNQPVPRLDPGKSTNDGVNNTSIARKAEDTALAKPSEPKDVPRAEKVDFTNQLYQDTNVADYEEDNKAQPKLFKQESDSSLMDSIASMVHEIVQQEGYIASVELSGPEESVSVEKIYFTDEVIKEIGVAGHEINGKDEPSLPTADTDSKLIGSNASLYSNISHNDGNNASAKPSESKEDHSSERAYSINQKIEETGMAHQATDGTREPKLKRVENETNIIENNARIAAKKPCNDTISSDLIATNQTSHTKVMQPMAIPKVSTKSKNSKQMLKNAQERNRLAIEKKIKQMSAKSTISRVQKPMNTVSYQSKVHNSVTGKSQKMPIKEIQVKKTEARQKKPLMKEEKKPDQQNNKKRMAALSNKITVSRSNKAEKQPINKLSEYNKDVLTTNDPSEVPKTTQNKSKIIFNKDPPEEDTHEPEHDQVVSSGMVSNDLPQSATPFQSVDTDQKLEDNDEIIDQEKATNVRKSLSQVCNKIAVEETLDLQDTSKVEPPNTRLIEFADNTPCNDGHVDLLEGRKEKSPSTNADKSYNASTSNGDDAGGFSPKDALHKKNKSTDTIPQQVAGNTSKSLSNTAIGEQSKTVKIEYTNTIQTPTISPKKIASGSLVKRPAAKAKQLSDTNMFKSTNFAPRKMSSRVFKKPIDEGLNKSTVVKDKQLSDTSIMKPANSVTKKIGVTGLRINKSHPKQQSETSLTKVSNAAPMKAWNSGQTKAASANYKCPFALTQKVLKKSDSQAKSISRSTSKNHRKSPVRSKEFRDAARENIRERDSEKSREKRSKQSTDSKPTEDFDFNKAVTDDKTAIMRSIAKEFYGGGQILRATRGQHNLSAQVTKDVIEIDDKLIKSHTKHPSDMENTEMESSVDGPVKSTSLTAQLSISSGKLERVASLPNKHALSSGKPDHDTIARDSLSLVYSGTQLVKENRITSATSHSHQDDEDRHAGSEADAEDSSKDTTLGINLRHIFYYYFFSFLLFVCTRFYEGEFTYDVTKQ